ncbi:MAG TPA: stage II sporulation protein M [Candidatus Nanoarchaeia archaeon]|nr:stage II sporulation protein M [Candidatus Nanoarchaeia archaeon]
MVFESLISPWKAEKHPWELFFFGFLYTSVALSLSLWIFTDYAGLVSVFLTVMSCIPLMYKTLRVEEEKIDYIQEEGSLLREHGKALSFFIFLFLGITFAFTTWYVAFPTEVSQSIFSVQIHTILDINGSATAGVDLFTRIFFNNVKVLTFCLLFSFFFGAGAIFILTWNASVIAAAAGGLIKSHIFASNGNIFFAYASGYSHALIRYFIHGIPEIAAYFIGALAGGIISVAIIRRDFTTKNFQKIAFDTSNLILLSIALLFVAGLIEAFVTPYFY